MPQKTVIKTKLVLKDLGNPKTAAGLKNEGDKHVLGTVIGIANKITTRTMPTGETYEGLGGEFEGRPADAERDIVRSGTMYLPSGVFETIADQLTDETDENGVVTKAAARSVQFAFEVATIKATNDAGYSWSFEPMLKPSEADPLLALRNTALPQLEAPRDEKPEAPKAEAQPANGRNNKK